MNTSNTNPTVDEIAALCRDEYGFAARVSSLPGENDNFLIELEDSQRYVFKLTSQDLSSEEFKMEQRIIEHLLASDLQLDLPGLVPTRSQALEARYQTDDGKRLCGRMLTFVPGTAWGEAGKPKRAQFLHLGEMLAKLNLALNDFDHPAARRTHRWDLTRAGQHRATIELVRDAQQRRLVEGMFHLYAASAYPRLQALPHCVIHADANDENVLVKSGRVTGLLDFGDCLYNPAVSELAIAMAYAMLEQPKPLRAGAEIVRGYHQIRPLHEEEIEVLFPLICGRLCTSVLIAAERRLIDPHQSRWFVTEAPAWALLERLSVIDPVDAGLRLSAKIDIKPIKDQGASPEALLDERKRYISPALSIAYRESHKMIRGEAQYLFDRRGRPFLDLVNNVFHVGHCHPRVVSAGQQQMAQLNTNTRYLYDALTEYAARLCETLPKSLNTCFFLNSGSEANELAIRLAMSHTGRQDFLVVENAYHGHTARLIAMSPYKFMGKGGSGEAESWVHVVPMPDGYRGKFRGEGREVGVAYGDVVGNVIAQAKSPIAGFLVEPLLSCGGQIVPPPGYLEAAFHHVRQAGGVCIADEVQVGFGRAGSHFWAFELQDVEPDVVVMGKPIGNGHPMAAVVTTAEIADSFDTGMEFFSTFGGNPVSCAIGLAVLDVIRDEELQRHALTLGERFLNGMHRLMAKHTLIGDVRGVGLFLGMELVRDRLSLEPATEEADALVQRLNGRGLLLSTDGPFQNVIKIKPPMVLNTDDVDMAMRIIDDELAMIETV